MSQDHPPYRPLSPHLQIWRWHITMLSSILHRASGVACVAGLVMVTLWLVALALGPVAYTLFLTYAASPLGLLVWFGLSLAGFLHLFGGIRHLIWDLGLGFKPKTANLLSGLSIFATLVATAALWACLILCGKVTL